MTEDATRGEQLLRAVRQVAGHRPALTVGIVLLSAASALLSGIGIGFIIPIIELTQSDASASGITGLFVRAYDLVGVPLTLETAVLGVALVMTAQYSLRFLTGYLRTLLRADFVRALRLRASRAALDARVGYYDDHGSDGVINTIVTQSNYAGGFISNGIELFQAVLVAVVYVAVAAVLAPEMTALTAVVFLVLAGAIRLGFGSGYDAGEAVADANETVQRAVQASTQGIRAVKLFGLRSRFAATISQAVEEHTRTVVTLGRNRAAFQELQGLVSALTVFALLYLGIAVFAVPLAELAAFLFAMFRLAPQVSNVNSLFFRAEGDLPHVVRTAAFIERLGNEAEPSVPPEAATLPATVDELRFEGVSFAYDDQPVLRDVSFSVSRPSFVALVGPSGAGKSTVVSLLARFYEPDAGRITADGTPIDRFELGAWRERLAVVRQQPYVFDDTLAFNLRVGAPDASRAELERVCELAQVTEFLDDLPEGFETPLGDDGVRLSGGQRQRVAIARALLTDADVLVLDEATSDLDTDLEAKVHHAIEAMDRDVITVAIAHRLSTVVDADRIHVFDGGEIVESGTHEELVAGDGTYASLYAMQGRA